MTEEKVYRYVAKDENYATRWRKLPKDGIEMPSKKTAAMLGKGYSLQARTKAKKR